MLALEDILFLERQADRDRYRLSDEALVVFTTPSSDVRATRTQASGSMVTRRLSLFLLLEWKVASFGRSEPAMRFGNL